MSKVVGYARVSTKDQCLDRQIDNFHELNIDDKYIYIDKQSGKNFDRVGYQYMKKSIEQGDTIVIKDLKRLGRNQREIKEEWQYFMDNGINIRVIDIPSLNIDYNDEQLKPMIRMIKEIVFSILSWQAEDERVNILETQRQGILSAKSRGVTFGRPKKNIPDTTFKNEYLKWKNKEQTAVYTMKKLNISRSLFYQKVKDYEKNSL